MTHVPSVISMHGVTFLEALIVRIASRQSAAHGIGVRRVNPLELASEDSDGAWVMPAQTRGQS